MKKITALPVGKGRLKRLNIFLDGKYAFETEEAKEHLPGDWTISMERTKARAEPEGPRRCLDAAIRFLSYRPRSEFELKVSLQRRGFDEDSIGAIIARLKELGLVDDMAFAQFWKDNRESFSPRSQRLTRLELRRKGISDEISEQVVSSIEDEDSAYRAALSKFQRLSRADYEGFRRRLGEYLKRRGFSYGVINRTVERMWQEH